MPRAESGRSWELENSIQVLLACATQLLLAHPLLPPRGHISKKLVMGLGWELQPHVGCGHPKRHLNCQAPGRSFSHLCGLLGAGGHVCFPRSHLQRWCFLLSGTFYILTLHPTPHATPGTQLLMNARSLHELVGATGTVSTDPIYTGLGGSTDQRHRSSEEALLSVLGASGESSQRRWP